MIAYLNPLQGEEFLDLCCVEPIIGARICSWYCCYANAYPFCDLWILYSDKKNPDFPAAGNHLGYPHGVAARYQGTLCIACDLEVDFEELAEFVAGSGAMEVECLTPIMDELLPRIPYRLRQRQTVMTWRVSRASRRRRCSATGTLFTATTWTAMPMPLWRTGSCGRCTR